MDKIKELIKQGEELKSTFTKAGIGSNFTNDRENVAKWITMCTRELKKILTEDDVFYKKFVGWVNKIEDLRLDDFNELIGVLKGIEETPEDNETVFF